MKKVITSGTGICKGQYGLDTNERNEMEKHQVAVYYCDDGNNIGAVISLEEQKKSVCEKLEANPEWKISTIYLESQGSRERTALQRMLEDAEKHCFDILLAESAFSFSRDVNEAVNVITLLQNSGINVILLLEKTSNPVTLPNLVVRYLAMAAQSWKTPWVTEKISSDRQTDMVDGG